MPFGLKTAASVIGTYLDDLLAFTNAVKKQFATCGVRAAPIYKVLKYEGRVRNIEDIPSPRGMEMDVDYGTETVEAI